MGTGSILVLLLCGIISTSLACFPSKYWISCLIDNCKLGGSCPGDATAVCRMEKTDCNGCKAVWYTKSGKKANCSAKKDLQLCPGGEPVVHCKMDPCQWTCDHPKFRNAPCQKNYCGKCTAEYFVDKQWSLCPSILPSDAGNFLPIDTVVNPEAVVDNCIMVPCSIEVCIGQVCPAVKSAVCRPYACNECKPMWYLGKTPVDCMTGEFIRGLPRQQQPLLRRPGMKFPPIQRTCKPGESYQPCDQSVCNGKMCRNYPNAVCRPDGCGTCKATWFLDDKLVDCFSDQCPPNVPVVKCVDDPCKYFSQYCPMAECRASQCGRCEAKFFIDGKETKCAMPPKTCPPGVEPLKCSRFTCPAKICPGHLRLVCRVNPCGNECSHEWVHISTGEIQTCRTFERPFPGTSGSAGTQNKYKHPESNRIFFKDPIMEILNPTPSDGPLFIERKQSESKFHTKEIRASPTPGGGNTQADVGSFRVEPVFISPRQQVQDTDLLALLRSFPHEISAVPSTVIQNALRKPLPKIDDLSSIMPNREPRKYVNTVGNNFIKKSSKPRMKTAKIGLVTQDVKREPIMLQKPISQPIVPQPKPTQAIELKHNDAMSLPKGLTDPGPMTSEPIDSGLMEQFPKEPMSRPLDVANPDTMALDSMAQGSMTLDANNQGTMTLDPLDPGTMALVPKDPTSMPLDASSFDTRPLDPVIPGTMTLDTSNQGTMAMDTTDPNSMTLDKAMALIAALRNQLINSKAANLAAGARQSPDNTPSPPVFPKTSNVVQPVLDMTPKQKPKPKPRSTRKPKRNKPVSPISINNGGLPISMQLFNQWSSLPL